MAGFWRRLLSRLSRAPRRRTRRRFLKVEMLENRRLMATDLASISGIAFSDLTGNGLTGDDPRLSAVTVRLYRDANSNSTFELGTDTLVETTLTNATGNYRFDNLLAGTYFVQQTTPTGFTTLPGGSIATVTVSSVQAEGTTGQSIDNFNTTAQSISVAQPGTTTASSSVVAPESIGGERDMRAAITSSASNFQINANLAGSAVLAFDASSGAEGTRVITYDGVDSDGATLNATGLGGINLQSSNAVGFRFRIGSNQSGTNLVVRVYSSATNFSVANVALPNNGGVPTGTAIVRFSEFTVGGGTGANFTNVGAIEFGLEAGTAVDVQVDTFETAAVVDQTANFQNFVALSLGDLVFRDNNNNGVADAGEPGIANVTLQLYSDTNSNGTFDSGTDTLQATTTTNSSGVYQFASLVGGDYIVVIPVSNFNAGGALQGLSTSTGNDPSPDPDNNTNGDDNGSALLLTGVVSQAITLAAGTEPTNDGDTNANTNFTLDFGFVPNVDVSVVKTDSPDPVIAGNQITYTLAVANAGPSAADNVVLTDVLPAGVTFVSVTPSQGTAANASGTVTANLGTINAGGTATVTLIVSVPSSTAAGTSISNTATVTSSYIDTNAANNTSTVATTVNRSVDLAITKTDTPDPVLVTGQITYTLTVTNNGPSSASGVTINDVLPATLGVVSVTPSVGTVNTVGNNVTVNVGNLAAAATATVTIVASISDTTITTVSNTATVTSTETDSNAANNTSTTSTTVNPAIDLVVTKTDSADPVVAGNALTYTVTVTNNGPSTATNVVLTDALPASLTFVSATSSQGTATFASGTVTGTLGTLASGASATVTINTTVSSSATGTITNTASAIATQTDINASNNTATQNTTLNSQVDLAVTKTDGLTNVISGNNLTYTITVTNNGPSVATGVTLTDTLPATLTPVSNTISQGTASFGGQTYTANIGTLNPGQSVTATIVATVIGTASGVISNTATASSTQTDSNNANNSATDTTTAQRQTDLRIAKSDSPDPVIAGNQLTYTIIVNNDGPSTASGVTVTDVLPAGVTFVSASTTAGTVANAAGTVTGTIGTLASGGSATITIIASVDPATRGTITNTATVTGAETDTNNANNSATTTTTANGSVDVSIVKADSADPSIVGNTLTYTLTIQNNGPSTATNVVITDILPAGLTFSSATTSQGTVSNSSGTVTANLGNLAPTATATVTIVTNPSSSITQQTITNTATVASAETDTNTANNTSTQSTVVYALASLSGFSYIDANRNGVKDTGELPIAGVIITLSGTNFLGSSVSAQATTNSSGQYNFTNLAPGTYTLQQTQPTGFQDGASSVGTPASGVPTNNQIASINLTGGVNAASFNFGDIRQLSKRRFLASTTD